MAKPTSQIPQAKLDLYDMLLGTQSGVQRKGASMPYTSLNGNMFSFLTATGSLVLRLPEGAHLEFLKKYKTKLVEQHGAVLKE